MNEIEKQQRTEEVLRDIANGIESVIKHEFGENFGFMLLVFNFKEPGIANYISNAKRKGMITSLRETADRLEKNQDIPVAQINNTTIQ